MTHRWSSGASWTPGVDPVQVGAESSSHSGTVYMLRRNNWDLDGRLNTELGERLEQLGLRVEWENVASPPDAFWDSWRDRTRRWPRAFQRVGLWARKLVHAVAHPRYLPVLIENKVPWWCRIAMSRRISRLARGGAVVLVGRSAGAVLATRIADRLPVAAVVCLGYPFQNPRHHPEPARYLHLRSIQTPTLILQGAGDAYGGSDVAERYELSSAVEVRIVDTNHEFTLDVDGTDDLLDIICAAVCSSIGS